MVLGMKKALMVAFVVFLLCFSVGSVRAYTNQNNFFSIDEPSGWTTDETATGNVVVTFYEPTSNNASIVLIQIIVETVSSDVTLEELVTSVKEQYPSVLDNFVVISESGRVVNGVDAYEIVATVSQQGYDLKIKQVMIVKNLRIYVVTYAAAPARYQQFLSNFEDSVETFTVLDPIPWYFWYVFFGVIVAVLAAIAVGLYFYKKRANSYSLGY